MYTEILTKVDLAQNEAKLYETLLRYGKLSAGEMATKAQINRRNVYDSISRLIEKGLLYEIVEKKETLYQAVDPKKLLEIVKEKESALESIMPDLEGLIAKHSKDNAVFVYQGVEGWKNYMRDLLRVGEEVFTLGARGAWLDPRTRVFLEQSLKEAERKGIKFNILFDHQATEKNREIIDVFPENYRILPKGFSTTAAIEIFGDHVVILSGVGLGVIEEGSSATVIVNPFIADAFRTWWQFMWNLSKPKSGV